MDTYIQYIERINQYINNTLSSYERRLFELHLITDPELKTLYEEHLIFLGGIQRVELKQEIQAARKSHFINKWIKYTVITFGVIVLSVLAYSFLSNDEGTDHTGEGIETFISENDFIYNNHSELNKKDKNLSVHSVADITSALSPINENFTIKVDEDSFLKGAKGTTIYIPKYTFQYEDGTEPTGTISLELKECFNLVDMISENLQTTSRGQILETNGMIYINAKSEGKKLYIKNDKAIAIGFPKNDSKKEMDLFYDFEFNDSINTWVPDYKLFEAKAIKESIEKTDTTSYMGEDTIYDPNYPIEMTDDMYDFGFFVSLRTGTFDFVNFLGSDETVVEYLENSKNTDSLKAYTFHKNNWRADFDFNINKKGEIINLRPNKDVGIIYEKGAIKMAREIFQSLPPFDVANFKKNIKTNWTYSLGISNQRSINWKRFKQKFRKKYAKYRDSAVQKLDSEALKYYMFSATEMGWINCDRFWDVDDDEKTDFIVKTDYPDDTKIQIVFKDIKSIMNGSLENGTHVFKNIPKGKEVKIIGISYSNGKPTLALGESTTDNKTYTLSGFKEFTLDQLETELNTLN